MSRVTGNGVRIGESNTQTNNFSIETTNAGKLTLHRGNVGNNLGTVLEVDTAAGTSDLQIGSSATSTNNFHLKSDGAGGCALYRGNVGTTTTPVLTVDNAGLINVTKQLTLGTAQSTTSGTSIDFTGIPSWVKRITFIFNSTSSNGTSRFRLQLGSGSITTSGYTGILTTVSDTSVGGENVAAAGFDLRNTFDATSYVNGTISFNLISGNIWVCGGNVGIRNTASTSQAFIAGQVPLAGTLDRIRLTTVNGTDTFDAGSVNIMYE